MRRLVSAAAILLFAIAAINAKDTLKSTYAETFPANDTTVNWQNGMYPVQDGRCFVNLYNNNSELYFQIVVKDRQSQAQFLNRGMTVYLDLNGKEKKKYSINFPSMRSLHRHSQGQKRQDDINTDMPMRGGEGMMPPQGMPGRDEMDGDSQDTDTASLRRVMPPRTRADRERHLKMMLSQLSSQPIAFKCDDEEMMLPEGSVKVTATQGNIIYSGAIPYERLGKMGKSGEIALGIATTPVQTSSDRMPQGGPGDGGMMGGPGGGMMPPGGGMMGGPGMGGPGGGMGSPRGDSWHRDSGLNKNSNNSEKKLNFWVIFSTK